MTLLLEMFRGCERTHMLWFLPENFENFSATPVRPIAIELDFGGQVKKNLFIPTRILCVWISLVWLVLGHAAFAFTSETAPFASGAKVDANGKPVLPTDPTAGAQALVDPEYKLCGQECSYGKANENLTLQILYSQKKLEFLNRTESDSTAQADLDKRKREVLRGFCGESEPIDDCVDRYRKVSDLWLAKARISLATNEKSQSNLQCTQYDANGKCLVLGKPTTVALMRVPGEKSEEEKRAQTPYLSTSAELGQFKTPLDHSKMMDNATWTKDYLEKMKPHPEDFPFFKTIPRDPDNPSLGYFVVPASGPDGKPLLDKRAYEAALAVWQQVSLEMGETTKDRDIRKVMEEEDHKFRKEFSGKVRPEARTDSRKILDDARAEYIHRINNTDVKGSSSGMFGNQNTGQMSFSGAPKPAPGAPHKPVPGQYEPGFLNNGVASTGEEQVKPVVGRETSGRTVRYEADGILFDDPTLNDPETVKKAHERFKKQEELRSHGGAHSAPGTRTPATDSRIAPNSGPVSYPSDPGQYLGGDWR